MSALRIAAVTHVLKDLLNDGLINGNVTNAVGTTILVSSLSPGQLNTGGTPDTQLNLFLYRVSPNIGWNNIGYPSRNGRGELINNPPLALNLHYLLTAFGERELHAEILLGYAMQILHEQPILSRERIRNSFNPAVMAETGEDIPDELLQLSTANLADQFEQIKITPEPINTEEISKLWAAFQTQYRPCTAYTATVVLLERERTTKSALPVRERRVFAIPFKQPVIEKILSQQEAINANPIQQNRRIVVGDRLFIRGYQLKKDGIQLHINGHSFVPAVEDITDTEIKFIIPTTLPAGLQGIQIVHPMRLVLPKNISENNVGEIVIEETPVVEERKGASSNLFSFVLSPQITIPNNINIVDDAVNIVVNFVPALQQGQRVSLLLNQNTNTAPRAYSAILPAHILGAIDEDSSLNQVTFNIPDVQAGDYIVRVQVNGAESPLERNIDGNITNPILTVNS